MRKTAKAFAILLLLAVVCWPVCAQAQSGTAPFTSLWNDYTTSVPARWKVVSGNEGTHYTDINFKSPEPYYLLSIRWFSQYATHKKADESLEMYRGADDFVKQLSESVYQRDYNGGPYNPHTASAFLEPVHEVMVAGRKSMQFVLPAPGFDNYGGEGFNASSGRHFLDALGIIVKDKSLEAPGEHAYTLVPMRSGFYVLAYFAPQGGLGKYKRFYEEMVSSFVLLKDGPEGASLPGSTPQVETPGQKLQHYLSVIKSQREPDLQEPVCKQGLNEQGDLATVCCCLFANLNLRKEIVQFVAAMQPPPAIPEEAIRYFVEGNVFLKAAKNAADYKLAINKYKEALVEAPWWGDAYNNLGIALNAAGRREDAKQALQLYLLTKPADAGKARAKIYEIRAQQQLEEEHKRRCTEFEQEVNQGVEAYHNHMWDAAIEHYKKALEACPEHPRACTAYCNLGAAYVGKRNLDDGLKYAQKGLELKPDDVNCNGQMADTLWFRGDQAGACQYYKKACDLGAQQDCKSYMGLCP